MLFDQPTRKVYKTGCEPAELARYVFADMPEPFTPEEAGIHMGTGRVDGPTVMDNGEHSA